MVWKEARVDGGTKVCRKGVSKRWPDLNLKTSYWYANYCGFERREDVNLNILLPMCVYFYDTVFVCTISFNEALSYSVKIDTK